MIKYIPPIALIIVLMVILPYVRRMDRQRQVNVSVLEMQKDLQIENKTDMRGNEIALIETRINDLIASTGSRVELGRGGNIRYYQQDAGDEFIAEYMVQAVDCFIFDNSIKIECVSESCITITQVGTFSDEKNNVDFSFILLQSQEQGDRIVQYLNQYEQIVSKDTQIDTGAKRGLKRMIDKIM